jgi:hypothetical protein
MTGYEGAALAKAFILVHGETTMRQSAEF